MEIPRSGAGLKVMSGKVRPNAKANPFPLISCRDQTIGSRTPKVCQSVTEGMTKIMPRNLMMCSFVFWRFPSAAYQCYTLTSVHCALAWMPQMKDLTSLIKRLFVLFYRCWPFQWSSVIHAWVIRFQQVCVDFGYRGRCPISDLPLSRGIRNDKLGQTCAKRIAICQLPKWDLFHQSVFQVGRSRRA